MELDIDTLGVKCGRHCSVETEDRVVVVAWQGCGHGVVCTHARVKTSLK
jgi:hypothetical protein